MKQKIDSFRFVGGREQLESETAAAQSQSQETAGGGSSHTLRELNFVSVVFAPMAPNNLDFARQAVFAFLKNEVLPNTYVSIFRLDTRLRLILPYNHDLEGLRRAANEATKIYSTHDASAGSTTLSTQTALTALAQSSAPAGPGSGNPMATPTLNVNDPTFQRYSSTLDASTPVGAAAAAEAELDNRLRFVSSYVTGMTAMDNLRELVGSQARLPGRKVVLYLSDGLTLPEGRSDAFDRLVSDANRVGVTFYTVDTRGLAVMSPEAASVAQLNRTVTESSMQGAAMKGKLSGSTAFDVSSQSEDQLLLAVSDKQLASQELATRTGGFATANTNEIAAPMQRVMEDIRTHYEITYSPISDLYDGHFRKIDVKVDRPKMTVQARKGYYALPELNGQPLQPVEMAALTAVNTRPIPQSFAYRSALLQFRPEPNTVQCQVAFEIPVSSLSFVADPKTGKSRLRAFIFAIVQDANGQVVNKISRELVREIATSQIVNIKDEKIEYSEPTELSPGRYTISTVITDQQVEHTSVKRRVEVVAPVGHLRLSSLEVIRRVDPLPESPNPQDPFEVNGQKLMPTLTDNVPSGMPVRIYFVVYPALQPIAGEPKLTLEILRDGKEIARSSPPLSKPDSTGAIPVFAELSPPPGSYVLRATVQSGTSEQAQAIRTLTVE